MLLIKPNAINIRPDLIFMATIPSFAATDLIFFPFGSAVIKVLANLEL